MKTLSALLLCVVLSSCTALEAGKFLLGQTQKGGINTDLQVGDKQASLGDTIDVKGENVSVIKKDSSFEGTAQNVVINESDNKLVIILVLIAIIGWLLPTPSQIWTSLTSSLRSDTSYTDS